MPYAEGLGDELTQERRHLPPGGPPWVTEGLGSLRAWGLGRQLSWNSEVPILDPQGILGQDKQDTQGPEGQNASLGVEGAWRRLSPHSDSLEWSLWGSLGDCGSPE